MAYGFEFGDKTYPAIIVVDPFDVEELIEAANSLFDDPRFAPGMPILFNFVGANLSSAGKKDIDRFMLWMEKNIERRGKGSKSAALVSSDVAFGILRMYQAYSDHIPVDVQIFKTLPEADEWLRRP